MSRCFGSDDSPRNGPAWTNKNTPSYRIEPAVPLYSSISANEAPERNRGRRSSHALGPRHCRWATERCGRRVPPHALRYAGTRLSSLQSSANWRGLCHRGDRVCPMSTSGNVPSLGLPRLIKGRDPRFWGLEGLVFRRIFGRWPLRQPHREVSVWHPRANSPPPRGTCRLASDTQRHLAIVAESEEQRTGPRRVIFFIAFIIASPAGIPTLQMLTVALTYVQDKKKRKTSNALPAFLTL